MCANGKTPSKLNFSSEFTSSLRGLEIYKCIIEAKMFLPNKNLDKIIGGEYRENGVFYTHILCAYSNGMLYFPE